MKRTLVQQIGGEKAKRAKDGSSDDEEPVLPTRATGSIAASSSGASGSAGVVKKPTPKLASIFQPRSINTAASTNSAASGSSKGLKWLDPLGPNNTCLHGVYDDPQPSSKVAFYDLDGTVVRPKGRKTFPSKTDEYDFEFLFASPPRSSTSVIERIQQQHSDGFAVVIITNQKQTQYSAKSGLATWKKKMAHIAAVIDVPLRVLAALGDDVFRKPRLGMWEEFVRVNGEVDAKQSFFVGDAAGRKRYGDHSDTDLKWALNAGLGFYTPEEYFLGKPKEHDVPVRPWSPVQKGNGVVKGLIDEPEDEMETVDLASIDTDQSVSRTILADRADSQPEIVLFVGAPASGKTFLFNRVFAPSRYAHVNQDLLRTRDKCLRVVADTIAANQSCVVDNTNRDRATRKLYIELARKLDVKVRCVYFDVDKATCVHNNHYRALVGPTGEGEVKRGLLPYTAIESWFKDRQVPRREEGFDGTVVRVRWGWCGDEETGKRWRMYYH